MRDRMKKTYNTALKDQLVKAFNKAGIEPPREFPKPIRPLGMSSEEMALEHAENDRAASVEEACQIEGMYYGSRPWWE